MTTPTSIAALKTTAITPIRDRVYEVIEMYGADGCITDDVIAFFKKTDKTNTGRITGRFSELVAEGRIVRVGDTRKGASGKQQMVMRASKFVSPSMIPAMSKKVRKTGFLAGLMYAAKIVVKASDMNEAKKQLKSELLKVSKRSPL